MVTTDRQVGWVRYRKVWFPSREEVLNISQTLQPDEVVRIFAAQQEFATLPLLVKHRQLRTAWLDLSAGPERLLQGMKRKSCRYEIHRAQKMLDRVRVEVGSERSERDFLAVYNDFARAKTLPQLSLRSLREYGELGETHVLYRDAKPLCCHFLLQDPARRIVRLLNSASRRLDSPEESAASGALNRYLHWQEIQRYFARGFSIYDFGGIIEPEEPVSRFKLSFGGALVTEHYYLLSGRPWVAKLGNLVYENFLNRSSRVSKREAST